MTDDSLSAPRRGAAKDADDQLTGDDSAASSSPAGRRSRVNPDGVHEHAAFMRPGAAATAAGASTPEQTVMPEQVSPQQQDPQDPDLQDPDLQDPAQVAPDHPEAATPDTDSGTTTTSSGTTATSSGTTSSPAAPAAATPAGHGERDELRAGRQRAGVSTPVKVIAGLAGLGLAVGAFFGVRQFTQRPSSQTTVTTTPSTSSTPSPSSAPALTTAMLLTAADAGQLGGTGWKEAQTLDSIPATAPGVTCMSNLVSMPNPVITRQRGLTGTGATKPAALQRVDAYASAADAQRAYDITFKALAACNDVPAFIQSAAAITGTADQSASLTVAFQDKPTQYHTIVIARTGVSVSMLDAAHLGTPIDPQKVVAALTPTLAKLAGPSKGTAPTKPTATVTAVPSTPILGWLASSDLPRITPGQGMWSATEVSAVTSKGSQCEDLTLATVAGPTKREQRSYLLNQDDAAPDRFGIDEVLFTFAKPADAAALAKKLGDNITGCAKRANTAKVGAAKPFTITGQDAMPVSGTIWRIEQATAKDASVFYRVGVAVAGNRVTYTVSKVTASYDFTDDSFLALNARAGQRSTHTR